MFFRLLHVVALVVLLASFALANDSLLTLSLPGGQMDAWSKVTALTMQLKYGEAMAQAKKLRAENDGVGCVLENVVRISIYDDKGDTSALLTAGREQEARAFFAIYAYYIDKSFSWVPFKSDNRSAYLAVLDSASINSKRFWPLFLTPLIWMHYDKEDYAIGLKLSERGLSRAPSHPVMLQIKADMLYRLKRYDDAAAIYERSAMDYFKRTGASIRYWCAVLNLVRIYHDAGKENKAREWRGKLDDDKFKSLKDWMPSSLMDDLNSRDLI